MASYKLNKTGTCSAFVETLGYRKCKTFPTKEMAESWARSLELKIKRQKTIEVAASGTVLATMIPKRMLTAISRIPHTMQEVLDAAVPAKSFVGIYFLINDGEIVYVGQSISLLTRIARHRKEGKEFDSYSYLTCEQDQLNELEATYITALMPWLNFSLGQVPRNE